MSTLRSLKRNVARNNMKKAGKGKQMNKKFVDKNNNNKYSFFSRNWRDFVNT